MKICYLLINENFFSIDKIKKLILKIITILYFINYKFLNKNIKKIEK